MNLKNYKYQNCKGAKRVKNKQRIKFISMLSVSFLLCLGVLHVIDYLEACGRDFTPNSSPLITTNIVKAEIEPSVEEQIRKIADNNNFQWPDYLVRLAYCESRLDPFATNENKGHSLDRGLFQINKYYHPEVSNACAFDIQCSTQWTIDRINSGYQHEWMCDKLVQNK